MAKKIAAATSSKEVTAFATSNLKDYVVRFFKSLLGDECVASPSEIDSLHKRIAENEDSHKSFMAKVTQSTSASNQTDVAVKPYITSLLSSRDEIKLQLASLHEEVKNLIGVIRLLSDDV